MEFPNEIKEYILSYLPHPYKKPPHLDAINKSPLFMDFTIEREMMLELEPMIISGSIVLGLTLCALPKMRNTMNT